MESGIAIRIAVPGTVRRIRRLHDDAATLGIPPHVTILYPFLPPDRLRPSVRQELARIARAHEPFDVELTAVGRWPGVVHLLAEPADRLVALTTALAKQWPDFPPYGGAHRVLVPHLTVSETDDPAILDAVARDLAVVRLPIRARARRLEVMTELDDGRWRLRWRLPLGSRSMTRGR